MHRIPVSQALLCRHQEEIPADRAFCALTHGVMEGCPWDFCAAGVGLAERGTEEHGVKLGWVSRQKMCILKTTVTKNEESG